MDGHGSRSFGGGRVKSDFFSFNTPPREKRSALGGGEQRAEEGEVKKDTRTPSATAIVTEMAMAMAMADIGCLYCARAGLCLVRVRV